MIRWIIVAVVAVIAVMLALTLLGSPTSSSGSDDGGHVGASATE